MILETQTYLEHWSERRL